VQEFIFQKLSDERALANVRPAELAGWLESSRAGLATWPAPRSKVLCEAATLAVARARNDEERRNRALFLPLGVPDCAALRASLCETLAPAPATPRTPGLPPSTEWQAHWLCTGGNQRDAARFAAQSPLALVANAARLSDAFDWFSPGELAPALERCVRGEEGPQSSRKHECLSALSAIDAKRAKALLEDEAIWFPSIVEHFELAVATLSGVDPVARLKQLGLLPQTYQPAPWTDRSATGLMVDAGRATFVSRPEPEELALLAAGLVEGLVVEGSANHFSVWFKGERTDVDLSAPEGRHAHAIAEALNAAVSAHGVDVRWWVSRDEPTRVVVAPTQGLEAALKERLLLGDLPR
jgi:hypothetical protein